MSNIAIVIPAIHQESYKTFLKKWEPLFRKHEVYLFTVQDGEMPICFLHSYTANGLSSQSDSYTVDEVLEENSDLIINNSSSYRNLAFAVIAKLYPDIEYIITLEDDTSPLGDTIQAHIDALNQYKPISWMPIGNFYTRGFPYEIRREAEVWVSQGVWFNSIDVDSPSHLIMGNQLPINFYQMVIPRGVYFPFSGINVGFKRAALPIMYWCPVRIGFEDTWLGIQLVRECNRLDKAIVTGFAAVEHNDLSTPFDSLVKEASALKLNEHYWEKEGEIGIDTWDYEDDIFIEFDEKRERWKTLLKGWMQ